jgi:hypothetical protein
MKDARAVAPKDVEIDSLLGYIDALTEAHPEQDSVMVELDRQWWLLAKITNDAAIESLNDILVRFDSVTGGDQ